MVFFLATKNSNPTGTLYKEVLSFFENLSADFVGKQNIYTAILVVPLATKKPNPLLSRLSSNLFIFG